MRDNKKKKISGWNQSCTVSPDSWHLSDGQCFGTEKDGTGKSNQRYQQ